jgi:hypothetical protein
VGTAFASLVLREADVVPMAQLECAICLDVFAPGQAVLRMDCFWCAFCASLCECVFLIVAVYITTDA